MFTFKSKPTRSASASSVSSTGTTEFRRKKKRKLKGMDLLRANILKAKEELNGTGGESTKPGKNDETEQERLKRVVTNYLKSVPPLNGQKSVPQLVCKLKPVEDDVHFKIRLETKRLVFNRMSAELVDQDDLMKFYQVLEKYATVPQSILEGQMEDQKAIIYAEYIKAREECDPRIRPLLTPKLFMRLMTDDPYGRVVILNIFNYVMKKVWLKQTRIGLMTYDFTGKGFLTEEGLESYLRELMPTLPQLSNMDPSFEPFYICTAIRKFFFFLDPQRKLKIKIVDILASGLIDDILDLRETQMVTSNWFCQDTALRVYGHYLNLDKDHNGMLSKEEFRYYSHGPICLTEAFVDKLFNKCITYDGEMDYRTYVDFVLAFENKKEMQSIQYFFRILDIDQKGYMDASDIYVFYKDVQNILMTHTNDIARYEDIKDEIYDMVRPKDPLKITLTDLLESGMGHIVIHMLIDANGFWAYENRESFGNSGDSKDKSSEV